MKESFWFKHDYNARNDDKLLELRAEFGALGYGLYWMLLESMAESSEGKLNRGALGGLCLAYGTPKGDLLGLIDFCVSIGLFVLENDGSFYSRRMIDHKVERENFRKKGQEGAEKRWKNRGAITPAIDPPNAEQKRTEQKREEITPLTPQGESVGEDLEKADSGQTETLSLEEEKEKNKPPRSAAPPFVPPTADEVKAYFIEKTGTNGKASEKFAETFIAHYTQKGWKYGKTKMSSWRLAATSSWDMDEYVRKYANSPPSQPSGKITFNPIKHD